MYIRNLHFKHKLRQSFYGWKTEPSGYDWTLKNLIKNTLLMEMKTSTSSTLSTNLNNMTKVILHLFLLC